MFARLLGLRSLLTFPLARGQGPCFGSFSLSTQRPFSLTPRVDLGLSGRLFLQNTHTKGRKDDHNDEDDDKDGEEEEAEMEGEEVMGGIKRFSVSVPSEVLEVSHCRSSGPGSSSSCLSTEEPSF